MAVANTFSAADGRPTGATGIGNENFYAALPAIAGFGGLADPDAYTPVPEDWAIGLTDVVASTDAIRAGRYKAVNTAGAAVISAVSNALGTLDFPYLFAGDGMCYAVPPRHAPAARQALASSIAWVSGELGLSLRGGEITVAQIRETGRDVRIARFAASADASYAMFSGGGLLWAETELKAGRLTKVDPDPSSRPDLTGLSCRFKPVSTRHGVILSVIVSPRTGHEMGFQKAITELLSFVDSSAEASLPIRPDSLALPWPPKGFVDEARLQRKRGEPLATSLVRTGAWTLFSAAIMRTGRSVGAFSPDRYRGQIVTNSDHRKFEDRLMMTVDCSPAVADRIETQLSIARDAGVADFGLHRQTEALITCVVPSPSRPDHVHFIDGAAGGYTLAALDLKSRQRNLRDVANSPLALHAQP